MSTLYARCLGDSQITNLNQAVERAKVNMEKFGATFDVNVSKWGF